MRNVILTLIFGFFVLTSFCQTSKTMVFGGLNRTYIEYVPAIYDGSHPVPLVISLHGLGDNMNNFSQLGMHQISDTAEFIVLTPQAVSSFLGTAWNSGASYSGIVLNGNVNDVGFLNALIDSTAALYNIDLSRVYFLGFSMGSFMCHKMAGESGPRIAAIASVAGTIGTSYTCNPAVPMPVCHFHGTADATIAYSNCMYGMDAEELVDFWVLKNGCDTTPVMETLPDIVNDTFTVDHFYYAPDQTYADVEFYRVNGADHQWCFEGYNDIDYTKTIWAFFCKHQRIISGITELNSEIELNLFPNPVTEGAVLTTESPVISYAVVDVRGLRVIVGKGNGKTEIELNLSSLAKGTYWLVTDTQKGRATTNFVIE